MKNEKSVKETLEKVQNDLSLEQGEDLFASLLSDQKVMQNFLSLGFREEDVKDYLIPLSEYQASLHACAHCKNVNACQNSIPHFTYQLAVEDDGSLGLRMGRCEKILEKELAASRFLLRDFPEEWLLKFKEEPMTRNRKEVTLAYAKMNASKPFLYIKGALGTGKSFQAALLALAFVRRGEEAAFISCPKRSQYLGALIKLMQGKVLTLPFAKHILCERAAVTPASPAVAQYDGKLYQTASMQATLQKGGLLLYRK